MCVVCFSSLCVSITNSVRVPCANIDRLGISMWRLRICTFESGDFV